MTLPIKFLPETFAKKTLCCAVATLLVAGIAGCSFVPDQGQRTPLSVKQFGYSVPTRKPVERGQAIVKQKEAKIIQTSYLGRAPYICTPSGFGSTSRCFMR